MKEREKIDDGVSYFCVKEAAEKWSTPGNKRFLGLFFVIDDEIRERDRGATVDELFQMPVPDLLVAVRLGQKGNAEHLLFDPERDGQVLQVLETYGLSRKRASRRWTALPLEWVPDLGKEEDF